MLSAETENSKGLIAQLNQVRSQNGSSGRVGGAGSSMQTFNASSSRTGTAGNELTEDLKARLLVIGDCTGFQILSVSRDSKGEIFDCIVTDITSHGFG